MALMPPARAAAVLSNGLSPISSSMTSLPPALSALATPSTVKAVSTVKERANSLSCTAILSRRSELRSRFLAFEKRRRSRAKLAPTGRIALLESAGRLRGVRRNRVHERRREAVVRLEADLLQARADPGHFGRGRAGLDDR